VQNTNRKVTNMQTFDEDTLGFSETHRTVLPRAPAYGEMAFLRNVANHEGPAVSPSNVGPGLRGTQMSLVNDAPVTRKLPHVHSTYD
jgi:hypothetical protein